MECGETKGVTVIFAVNGSYRGHVPPAEYTTLTIGDELAGKIDKIMSRFESDSYAEAVEHAVDATLAQVDELSNKDLLEMLSD